MTVAPRAIKTGNLSFDRVATIQILLDPSESLSPPPGLAECALPKAGISTCLKPLRLCDCVCLQLTGACCLPVTS